jgi:hypothetical protein
MKGEGDGADRQLAHSGQPTAWRSRTLQVLGVAAIMQGGVTSLGHDRWRRSRRHVPQGSKEERRAGLNDAPPGGAKGAFSLLFDIRPMSRESPVALTVLLAEPWRF